MSIKGSWDLPHCIFRRLGIDSQWLMILHEQMNRHK
jgi:hypothetical protein